MTGFPTAVRFSNPESIWPHENQRATAARLVPGEIYVLSKVQVGQSDTRIWLAGWPSPPEGFSSVLFEPVLDEDEADEDAEGRLLTRDERIEARHWLQALMEHARGVRNAMDPVSGMAAISVRAWLAQRADLTSDLDAFTHRVRAGLTPTRSGLGDRNI